MPARRKAINTMQVLRKSTSDSPDLCCTVCGQGFVLSLERQSKGERAIALREVAKALRSHHNQIFGADAHPDRGFLVPSCDGPLTFSGAAILGNAPSWAL